MTNGEYKYLGPRQGSLYRQFFIKGRGLRAESVYADIVGPESLTPEESAQNWNLPLEAVLECIDYCEKNADLLRTEREEAEADLQRRRAAHPDLYPVPPKT
jgi:uncharacterized protein (DUF433 family)